MLAAFVLPWVLRNWIVLGRPLLVTSSGVTLLGGNCRESLYDPHPGKWVPPERSWDPGESLDGTETLESLAPPDLGMFGWSDRDEGASDAAFAARAWKLARARPADSAERIRWKIVRFLDPDTRSEKGDASLKAWAGWLSWGPTLLLVVAALWMGRMERSPAWRVALALLAGHLLAAMIAYGDARMRAPVEPALLSLLVAPLLAGWLAKWTRGASAATVTA